MVTTLDTGGYLLFLTPIGHCGLAWGGGGIVGVVLPEGSEAQTRARMRKTHPLLAEAMVEGGPVQGAPAVPPFARAAGDRIRGLLQGEKDDLLDLRLDMSALPAFHRRVYALVRDIGPAYTATYGEIAQRMGEPGAARAVGQALAKNPFAPVVPCHRVLAAASRLGIYRPGGFSAVGGVLTKLRMLQIEGARLSREPDLFD